MTTSSGSVAERYAYTAYGQPTILDGSGSVLSSSAINNRYTYMGREWDATLGLYYFRARWTSGLAGRFMGRDPIGYLSGANLQGQSMGLALLDPSGNYTWGSLPGNLAWTAIFGWYYYFGGGRSMNISGTRVLSPWRAAASDHLNALRNLVPNPPAPDRGCGKRQPVLRPSVVP